MARGLHLYRRGAVYYWVRRLPTHQASVLRISHVKVGLGTTCAAIARCLVPALDARAMELFMSDPQTLTRAQLGDIFKSVLVEHRTKLGLPADLERARPTADRSVRLSEERAQGTAFTLLAEQGADARLTPAH